MMAKELGFQSIAHASCNFIICLSGPCSVLGSACGVMACLDCYNAPKRAVAVIGHSVYNFCTKLIGFTL